MEISLHHSIKKGLYHLEIQSHNTYFRFINKGNLANNEYEYKEIKNISIFSENGLSVVTVLFDQSNISEYPKFISNIKEKLLYSNTKITNRDIGDVIKLFNAPYDNRCGIYLSEI